MAYHRPLENYDPNDDPWRSPDDDNTPTQGAIPGYAAGPVNPTQMNYSTQGCGFNVGGGQNFGQPLMQQQMFMPQQPQPYPQKIPQMSGEGMQFQHLQQHHSPVPDVGGMQQCGQGSNFLQHAQQRCASPIPQQMQMQAQQMQAQQIQPQQMQAQQMQPQQMQAQHFQPQQMQPQQMQPQQMQAQHFQPQQMQTPPNFYTPGGVPSQFVARRPQRSRSPSQSGVPNFGTENAEMRSVSAISGSPRSGRKDLVDGKLPSKIRGDSPPPIAQVAELEPDPPQPQAAAQPSAFPARHYQDEAHFPFVDVVLERHSRDEKWGISLGSTDTDFVGCKVRSIAPGSPADRWNADPPLPQYKILEDDVLILANGQVTDTATFKSILESLGLYANLVFLRRPKRGG